MRNCFGARLFPEALCARRIICSVCGDSKDWTRCGQVRLARQASAGACFLLLVHPREARTPPRKADHPRASWHGDRIRSTSPPRQMWSPEDTACRASGANALILCHSFNRVLRKRYLVQLRISVRTCRARVSRASRAVRARAHAAPGHLHDYHSASGSRTRRLNPTSRTPMLDGADSAIGHDAMLAKDQSRTR